MDDASDLHGPIVDMQSPKQKSGRQKSGKRASNVSQIVASIPSLSFQSKAFTVRKVSVRNAIALSDYLGMYCIAKFELQGCTSNADARKLTFEKSDTVLSYHYKVPQEKTDATKMFFNSANNVDNKVIMATLNKR